MRDLSYPHYKNIILTGHQKNSLQAYTTKYYLYIINAARTMRVHEEKVTRFGRKSLRCCKQCLLNFVNMKFCNTLIEYQSYRTISFTYK